MAPRLRVLFLGGSVGEGHVEEVLVEAAVGHGTVEAADGPDANGEGLGLHGAQGVAVALQRPRSRRRTAETLGL